jgi:hypothetical protein
MPDPVAPPPLPVEVQPAMVELSPAMIPLPLLLDALQSRSVEFAPAEIPAPVKSLVLADVELLVVETQPVRVEPPDAKIP